MLDHADAGDGVERLSPQLAVVGHANVDALADARVGGESPGQGRLGLGQRDPHHLGAVVGGGVDGEAAPAAAHVQDPVARPQLELRAHHLQLGALRLLQRAGAAREDRAAVGHRVVQEQREELLPTS